MTKVLPSALARCSELGGANDTAAEAEIHNNASCSIERV
jgi:hypothetical protein